LKKRIIVSVTNDLVTDQRVHKTCVTLKEMGFDILLVGRKLKDSLPMNSRNYGHHRMKMLFTKGALFYAEFNIRLFFFLLTNKFDVLTSNDLDTLLANFLISKIKKKPLVYDSHEYFTEVPELIYRPHVQRIWKTIEEWIFPKLTDTFTVNNSIATLFEKKYGVRPYIVRNIPSKTEIVKTKSRKELGLPEDKFLIIIQGSGINVQRGTEEVVEAMKFLNNAILVIVGSGDVLDTLKEMSNQDNIKGKVIFIPRQEYSSLMQFTLNADIGLTVDKDTNLNYRFSLPNKLFDYIRAGIPVLASDLVEIKKIITKYDIGDFIPDYAPRSIARKIDTIINNPSILQKWNENIKVASKELTWENESEIIKTVYNKYL